jgi:phosphatidylserine decarboxylase
MLIILVLINTGIVFTTGSSSLEFLLCVSASIIIYLLVLQFFRNPSRKQNLGNWVLCPADGKIVAIEKVFEGEYYKDERIQVSVFMSPLNVHINRFSISGKVTYFKYHQGLYLIASHPKSSTENERTTVVVENGTQSVLLRQIAGYVARRVLTYCKVGDEAKQGEEFGFIKFGSRVDILLPVSAQVEVKLGEVVKGGITRIANFNG